MYDRFPWQEIEDVRGRKTPWFVDPDSILDDLAKVSKRRRTDPLPLWRHDAMRKGRERKAAERERAARMRAEARMKARHAKRRGASDRMMGSILALMEPDRWYGLKALARAAGLSMSEAGRVKQILATTAWAERAANPAWDATPMLDRAGYVPPPPQAIQAGATREPKWLYRVTPAGIAAALCGLGAERDDGRES